MRFIGGGAKKMLRLIDRKYQYAMHSTAYVHSINYCPNFTANIALCSTEYPQPGKDLTSYQSDLFFYRVATKGLKPGDKFIGPYVATTIPDDGDVRFIKDIPEGRAIHNIEIKRGQGARYSRSAGSFATILSHLPLKNQTLIILPSNKTIVVNNNCIATVGKVGNDAHFFAKYGKAGVSR